MSAPFLLVRHGETDWNAERRIQGQIDTPLNARGREQAARNGEWLREHLGAKANGWRFLCSPMTRTRQTMAILRNALELDPNEFATDPRLVELHFGDWQGFTLREVEARHLGAVAARDADKWNFVPTGADAESYAALEARTAPVLEALAEPTVVVAHGGIARCVLKRWGGVEPADAAHRAIPQDRVLDVSDGTARWR